MGPRPNYLYNFRRSGVRRGSGRFDLEEMKKNVDDGSSFRRRRRRRRDPY